MNFGRWKKLTLDCFCPATTIFTCLGWLFQNIFNIFEDLLLSHDRKALEENIFKEEYRGFVAVNVFAMISDFCCPFSALL